MLCALSVGAAVVIAEAISELGVAIGVAYGVGSRAATFYAWAHPILEVADLGHTGIHLWFDCGPKFRDMLIRRGYINPARRGPLVLDLNGDGIKTTNVVSHTYFD